MQTTAAFYTGDRTFSIEQVDSPQPGPGEVQIDVAYCGICGTDLHVYQGHMDARVGSHRVIGHEMSGTVAEIGVGVAGFAPGDPVVVRPLDHCGTCPACKRGHQHICQNLKFLGLDTDGAFQQKWTVPVHTLHHLPEGLKLAHAALIEPLAVACHDVGRGKVQDGEDVLVIGGGPIGMLIAMVARHAGGVVTISEINEHRIAFAQGLGFATINPAQADAAKTVKKATGGKGADVVFEVSGSQPGVELMTDAAATRARIVMVAIHATAPKVDLFQFFWREIEMLGARVYQPADYEEAMKLLSGGAIDADAMITDVKGLDQVGDAFAELAGNPRAMKTLINCNGEA
ncbi:zinc-dependent alcohol dehydrogenase [Hoeflea prorocentri]|uniref:Alcohol dehydrogenase catalytic domain-containing protein n=1 Tax=Hoeflea prorocentri TaxID=1922333 RepID=A0A9X3ZIT0_9HYPH|nr:alcohol dehydrogenase catalytic domain-containing protein [Hoeflea prorocentri]MCY6382186.1 alcohol dehydrogenase catalytic domain-containing protein [Hoeflea prorocentri]MDA5399986.1 alcohol dehydrogenase catalytic domain-containing protein [Hoeflea prorocentri]